MKCRLIELNLWAVAKVCTLLSFIRIKLWINLLHYCTELGDSLGLLTIVSLPDRCWDRLHPFIDRISGLQKRWTKDSEIISLK